jgi:deoxycytidine triphosphate deaminase
LSLYPTVDHDPSGLEGGVLLSDEIRRLCGPEYRMVDPFHEAMLRSASIRLRVGEEYRRGTQILRLMPGSGSNEIIIGPGEMVIIQTLETLNLPRTIIARWNMKTDLVYRGLLWVGGPQVDPGWIGHLQCPIYNLSNEAVTLKHGDPFAIMDFQRTTAYTANPKVCVAYPRPPRTVCMEEYQYGSLKSSTEGAVSAVRGQLEASLLRVEGFKEETNTSVKEFADETKQSVQSLRDDNRATKIDQERERGELREMSTSLRSDVELLRNSVFVVMTVFVAAVGALATAVAVFVAKSGPFVQPTWFLTIAIVVLIGSVIASAYAAVRTSWLALRIRRIEKGLKVST